jgi:protein gp37
MADGSAIEWTDATWNFVTGCTRVSDGCLRCYIDSQPPFRMSNNRFDSPEIGGATRIILHPERLTIPLHWRKPRRVFINSLSDVFHEAVPADLIARAFAVMARTPQHTYQILTKRPARMRSLLGSDGQRLLEATTDEETAQALYARWPLPNVHLGVSVEDQHWADIRINMLMHIPAAVRFLSCEPLLSPVKLHRGHAHCPTHDFPGGFCTGRCPDLIAPDWVIVGGESAQRAADARPMHLDWARALLGDCRRAGIPVFVKQLGSAWAQSAGAGHHKGGDPAEWPEDLRVRQMPRAAGAVSA